MSGIGLSKRTNRMFVIVATIVVLLVYIPLNLFYMLYVSPPQQAPLVQATNILDHPAGHGDGKLQVAVSDIGTDANGDVKIVLSLNVKDLLALLDGTSTHGEATDHFIPSEVKLLINSPEVCRNSPKMKYIVYVHTSPEHQQRRDILRNTWLSRNLFSERIIERVFLMGKPEKEDQQLKIKAEAEKYGDIIQGDFVDNYKNLTLKGLMGLKWVSRYCKQAQFAIKSDDDSFVDVFKLLRLMKDNEAKKRLLMCPLWRDNSMPILRDPAKCAKWCVKFNEFPGKRYFPRYCAGLTFVLSSELVPLMYNQSKTTPFFWIDDVYMTGLLPAKVKDVEYVSLIKNFTLKQDEAITQLKDLTKPLTNYFVHAKKVEDYKPMWKLLLKRLPYDDVSLLSTEVIEQNPDLKLTLASLGKSNRLNKSHR